MAQKKHLDGLSKTLRSLGVDEREDFSNYEVAAVRPDLVPDSGGIWRSTGRILTKKQIDKRWRSLKF